jgi:zinc transport system substrate-binding protein
MSVIDCAEGISIKSGVESHADHGDPLGRDPHIWCSLLNAKIMVDNIVRGLTSIDPADSLRFAANAKAYKMKLDSLNSYNQALFAGRQNREFLIFHPAWGYFAADYGLVQVPIEFEGKEPHFDELKKLIQLAKSKGLKTVFVSPQFNPEIARTIAGEIGGKVEYLDPLAENYLVNMRGVAQKIAESLEKR